MIDSADVLRAAELLEEQAEVMRASYTRTDGMTWPEDVYQEKAEHDELTAVAGRLRRQVAESDRQTREEESQATTKRGAINPACAWPFPEPRKD